MPSPHSTSPSPPLHGSYNNSYYSHEEEIEQEPGFSELQTVAFAGFLTLLPLMFGLVSYFALRVICKGGRSRKGHIRRPYVLYCWGRFRRSVEPSDLSKALDKESSHRNRSSQGLLNDQLKSSESQFSVVPAEDIEAGASCYQAGNLTSKATANGSVITMTMRNNHLIVETETAIGEGGVDAEVENNDVLVVEVAPAPDSTAIVHQAPPSAVEEGVSPAVIGAVRFNTGLSTSDLSISSNASNRGYVYGNQTEYDTINNYEELATQQLICHIVAPVDTYIEPKVPIVKPLVPEGPVGSDLQLSLDTTLKGESNPAYLPTPVTAEEAAPSTAVTEAATISSEPATLNASVVSEERPTS